MWLTVMLEQGTQVCRAKPVTSSGHITQCTYLPDSDPQTVSYAGPEARPAALLREGS